MPKNQSSFVGIVQDSKLNYRNAVREGRQKHNRTQCKHDLHTVCLTVSIKCSLEVEKISPRFLSLKNNKL